MLHDVSRGFQLRANNSENGENVKYESPGLLKKLLRPRPKLDESKLTSASESQSWLPLNLQTLQMLRS